MRGTDPNWRWNGPPIPDVKPPYSGLFAGDDGTIWVRAHQPGQKVGDPSFDPTDPEAIPDEWKEPTLFDVFEEDGTYLGAVRGLDGLSRYPQPVFTRDRVLGILRDASDVQTVVRFRVVHAGDKDGLPG